MVVNFAQHEIDDDDDGWSFRIQILCTSLCFFFFQADSNNT